MTPPEAPAVQKVEGLTSCPFCAAAGEELGLCYDTGHLPMVGTDWFVRCYVCHVETARFVSHAEAIAAWNRRAPDPRIEALEAERDEARARLRNVPGLTPFNDAEDAAWPLAMARLQNTEPGPDQGIAMVGTGDLELALRRLSQFADVALRNAAVIGGLEARALSAEAQRDRMREALEPFADQADCYEDSVPDDVADWPTFKVHHFRNARAALSQGSGEEG